ncbi:MAG: hypothetical protein COA58_11805 [Bacteroidetes bacterium]|nr:MAG: hypothetical protein COA58_11805 [Bacteroidota bacterium]
MVQLSQIYGLQKIKQKLLANVRDNRLPHAQLFLGPEGSGKLGLALALTQYLYCSNKSETDSCGECSSCRKISSHTHPDVHFTFPTVVKSSGKEPVSNDFLEAWRKELQESIYFNTSDWIKNIADDENKKPNITRKETRDIISKLSLKPYEGEAKTLIIWMPEYLAGQSNALLKLIEEPPQKTYFILVAENSDALLATITSRTQLVKIPKYTEEETMAFLQAKYSLDPQKAEQIAYLAEGNFRKAIDLVESVEDNYSEMFRDWMLACYSNNLKTVSSLVDSMHKLGRVQLQIFLTNGLSILRESLLYKTIDNYTIKAEKDQQDFIRKFSGTLNAACIEKSYEQINEVIYHIQRNANAKIAIFNLSLNLRYNFVRKKDA